MSGILVCCDSWVVIGVEVVVGRISARELWPLRKYFRRWYWGDQALKLNIAG